MEPVFPSTEFVRCSLAAEVLRACGHLRLRVTGTSMLPAIWPGDELTIHRAGIDELRQGEFVLFMRAGSLFVHRVLRRSGTGLVTRGDAMPVPDLPVGQNEVLGRVTEIRRAGRSAFTPRRGARLSRAVGLSLCKSDRLRDLALRMHHMRSRWRPAPSPEAQ